MPRFSKQVPFVKRDKIYGEIAKMPDWIKNPTNLPQYFISGNYLSFYYKIICFKVTASSIKM